MELTDARLKMTPVPVPTRPDDGSRILLWLGIAAAVLPAHFLHLRSLGVYEDDYWAIVPFLEAGGTDLVASAKYHFSVWMTGRPLNYLLPALFSAAGSALAGLDGIFLLTGAALLANCILIHAILRRFVSAPTALFAAVFYGLYPADTTKILLVHGAHVQTSVTFALLAFYFYLRESPSRWNCYLIAPLSLLSYESAYLPFLFAPLLTFSASRRWLIRTGVHGIICVTTVAVIAAIRLSKGDSRATSVVESVGDAVQRSLTSLYLGPWTSVSRLIAAPIEGISHADLTGLVVAGAAVIVLVILGRKLARADRDVPAGQVGWHSLFVLAVSGVIFWSVSYGLAIVDPHFPPVRTMGRLTSVHVAGAVGATLLLAALVEAASRATPRRLRVALAVVLAAYVGLLSTFQYRVQRGFVYSWNEQQKFWSQVLTLAPDLSAGTAVLVTGAQAPLSGSIAANSWSDALVLPHFFRLPAGTEPPVLVMLDNCSEAIRIHRSDAGLRWRPHFWSGVEKNLDPENVIVLQSDYGRLSRIERVFVSTLGENLESKSPGSAPANWPRSFFHRQMFERKVGLP